MTALANPTEYLGTLPQRVHTLGGATFDPYEDLWAYRDGVVNVSLDFSSLVSLSPSVIRALKATLVWYAQNRSARHLDNLFKRMHHFARFLRAQGSTSITWISSTDLINYGSSLGAKQWYLGTLAGLLQKWHALGIAGVTDDAELFLRQVRLKGNQKGVAVLTMDSRDGPYTEIERNGIQDALEAAYEQGRIELAAYLLAWIFMLLGQRPAQYAALKVCDVSVGRTREGDVVYSLKVPRAKQRKASLRDQFKDRIILPQIGELLVNYAAEIQARFVGRLADPSQAPLFPANVVRKTSPGFEYHRTSNNLAGWMQTSLEKLAVMSERTGERLHITATRFRRTVGTRAAEEGYGELIIAELLDHSGIQNVQIYVQATPAILKRIDRAIAMRMAPLAQAFAGVLVRDESEATRGSDPASRIIDLRIDRSAKPMGSCGTYGFCGLTAPIACYTCENFQPWLDGPHEAVLAHLLEERERLMSTGAARIAAVNDRTILAVADVIRRCEEIHAEEAATAERTARPELEPLHG